MKRLDTWFGPPFSWFAGRTSRKHIRIARPPENAHEILLVKFLGFGSILLSMPLVRALRRLHPYARISYLTFEPNREVLEMLPAVDRVLTIDNAGLGSFGKDTLKVTSVLRKEGVDICINLEFFSCYATLMCFLINARYSMAYGGDMVSRNRIFDRLLSYERGRHIIRKMLNFAEDLGGEDDEMGLERPRVGREAEAAVQALLRALGPHRPLVAVYAASNEKAPKRRWPVERYSRVIRWLIEERGASVLLIGGPADVGETSRLKRSLGKPQACHNLAGRLSLKELAALLKSCDLFLGNDGGPLHLAASLGTRTVSLFGPESPEVYGPPESGDHTVIYTPMSCSPCLNVYSHKNSPCVDNQCMKAISSESVISAVERALGRANGQLFTKGRTEPTESPQ